MPCPWFQPHLVAINRLRNAAHATAYRPPDEECGCYTCRHHTLAYLHHLDKAREQNFVTLMATHNLRYVNDLFADIREAITKDEI